MIADKEYAEPKVSLIAKWPEAIVRSFDRVAEISLLGMMLLTLAAVIGRYFFNKPIQGDYEITELLMVIVVFAAMAYTAITRGHVSVDTFISMAGKRTKNAFLAAASIPSLIFFALVGWQSILLSITEFDRHDVFGTLQIPTWPFEVVIAVGSFLTCLAILPIFMEYVSGVWRYGWRFKVSLSFIIIVFFAILALGFWGNRLPFQPTTYVAGAIGLLVFLAIMFSGVWVGTAMGITGILGVAYISGIKPALGIIAVTAFGQSSNYAQAVIPLFILMGEFVYFSGMASDLYNSAQRWLGRLPGGLAMATVAACTGFGAISGSGLAATTAMGMTCIPEMRRFNYSPRLATGVVSAGATIGMLVPPSITLILYGILTEQPIGTLFIAGIGPGLLQGASYMALIYIMCRLNPKLGPQGPIFSLREKLASLKDVWMVLALFLLVIGGMYLGIFTPTEGGGIGAFGAFIIVIIKKRLNRNTLSESLLETGKTTAMVLLFLIGAGMLGYLLAVSRLPYQLAAYLSSLEISRYFILIAIIFLYLVFGCFMSELALIVLTVPIIFPLIVKMGFDPIWYGVLMVEMIETGGITPPVGMNVFVTKGIVPDVPMETIFKGAAPFVITNLITTALLVAFPQIALFLTGIIK